MSPLGWARACRAGDRRSHENNILHDAFVLFAASELSQTSKDNPCSERITCQGKVRMHTLVQWMERERLSVREFVSVTLYKQTHTHHTHTHHTICACGHVYEIKERRMEKER